ncbi:MAG: hypothetical protein KUG72_01415 [Pseudomonadales bacterium]|nr:hypothetical protein [Pseudomonadales bacterium]
MNFFGSFGNTKEEAIAKLMPVADQIIAAHQDGNYSAFKSVITDDLSGKVDEDSFETAYRQIGLELGALISKQLLGCFRREGNPLLLFAAKYSKTEDDVLIHVSFANGSSPPKIDWIWIE